MFSTKICLFLFTTIILLQLIKCDKCATGACDNRKKCCKGYKCQNKAYCVTPTGYCLNGMNDNCCDKTKTCQRVGHGNYAFQCL
ncbi:hypothetical protein ACQ4LE_010234 [Meloidogyne hapla]